MAEKVYLDIREASELTPLRDEMVSFELAVSAVGLVKERTLLKTWRKIWACCLNLVVRHRLEMRY
eukprot:890275-Amphidinium_carterae.1